jgi:hypothetical protein
MPTRKVEINDKISTISPMPNGISCIFTATLKLNAQANIDYKNHQAIDHSEEYLGNASLDYNGVIVPPEIPSPFMAIIRIPINVNANGIVNFKTKMNYEINYIDEILTGNIYTGKINCCWLISLFIMESWKDKGKCTIQDILQLAGPKFKELYDEDKTVEMSDPDWENLIGRYGLVGKNDLCSTPCELFGLLSKFGPLMVGIIASIEQELKLKWDKLGNVVSLLISPLLDVGQAIENQTNVMNHWIVVTGMVDTGNIEDSLVYYINPFPTTKVPGGVMTFKEFLYAFKGKIAEIPKNDPNPALEGQLKIKFRTIHFQDEVPPPSKVKAFGKGVGTYNFASSGNVDPVGITPTVRLDMHTVGVSRSTTIALSAEINRDKRVDLGLSIISEPVPFKGEAKEEPTE